MQYSRGGAYAESRATACYRDCANASSRRRYRARKRSLYQAPLVLPISSDLSVYESIFPLLNGFILTGGQDIDPARYGGPSTYEKLSDLTPQREEVECLILSYAYRYDIPTLGICRGMQVMNVFFGGTLYLDLADQFQGGDAAHLQQGSCGAISSNGI